MKRFKTLFWTIFLSASYFGVLFMLFIPFELEVYPHIVISAIISLVFAKLKVVKQELENKIFELKNENNNGK